MIRYDLAKMLEEVKRDERAVTGEEKKILTQEQIKDLVRRRRASDPGKPPAK